MIWYEVANYNGGYTYGKGEKGEYRAKTTPVGSLKFANRYGLYDMHGNVWEWCLDYWHENYENAPIDGSAWKTDPSNDSYRLLRGGSWDDDPVGCRSAYRVRDDAGCQSYNIGFRVVCAFSREDSP